MEWEIVPRDEQETVINIDYFEKTITIYTTRKQVARRLEKKVGKPTNIGVCDGKIYSVSYTRKLYDKDVVKFFSKTMLIGLFKEEYDTKDES